MKIKIEQNIKKTLKVSLIFLAIGLMLGALIVFAATPSSTFYISSGVYPGAPSYTVWREGSTYFAKDANGQLAYNNANGSILAQNVFDDVTTGLVQFKVGTYEIKNINITGKKGLIIQGEVCARYNVPTAYHGTVFKLPDASNTYIMYSDNAGTKHDRFYAFRNILFNGNTAGQSVDKSCLLLKNFNWLEIESCIFTKAGASGLELNNVAIGTISDSWFMENDYSGLEIVTCGALTFTGNQFTDNTLNGVSADSTGGVVEGLQFTNNYFGGHNGQWGLVMGGPGGNALVHDIRIIGNEFVANYRDGLYIYGNQCRIYIIGNWFEDNSRSPIDTYDGAHFDNISGCIISGNSFSNYYYDCQRYGLTTYNVVNSTIVDNDFYGYNKPNLSGSILISGSVTNSTIHQNMGYSTEYHWNG